MGPGPLEPDPRPAGARGRREQDRVRPGRPLPGARPPGGRDPRQPRALRSGAHVAVVNASILPSGEMVRNVDFTPPVDAIRGQIDRFTRAGDNVAVDARRLSEGLFGDYLPANMLVLGVAYQAGRLPLTAAAVEEAVRLNGVAVDQNLQAFRYGRLWVVDPDRVRALVEPPAPSFEAERAAALGAARRAGRERLRVAPRPLRGSRPGGVLALGAPRRRAGRLPGRPRRGRLRGLRRRGGGARGGHRARARRRHPRGDPEPVQAYGLQGRVRGRAPPSGVRVPRGDARALRRAAPGLLALPTRRSCARSGSSGSSGSARGSGTRSAPFGPSGASAGRPTIPSGTRRYAGRSSASSRGTVGSSPTALAAGGPDAHAAAIELARLPESIRGYEDIKLRSIAKVRGQASTLVSRAATIRST